MQYEVGFTDVEGISMRARYRLIGNAFHAGVMRHLLLCYVSSVAMKGVILRDDVRQSGVPFTMNQDGPRGVQQSALGQLAVGTETAQTMRWGWQMGWFSNGKPRLAPRRMRWGFVMVWFFMVK